ncbi:hypothetical protein EW145_g3997 [Phellinidium pouzarii]|uniref:Uncharacterized protein n=1 Tax=Phellinidium pouzarii TaxID=167371 RepID=A0A4S4L5L6_9AGAM|nr:hypothetical protein EW145_g3997 [Phellinidium pouzarii]
MAPAANLLFLRIVFNSVKAYYCYTVVNIVFYLTMTAEEGVVDDYATASTDAQEANDAFQTYKHKEYIAFLESLAIVDATGSCLAKEVDKEKGENALFLSIRFLIYAAVDVKSFSPLSPLEILSAVATIALSNESKAEQKTSPRKHGRPPNAIKEKVNAAPRDSGKQSRWSILPSPIPSPSRGALEQMAEEGTNDISELDVLTAPVEEKRPEERAKRKRKNI